MDLLLLRGRRNRKQLRIFSSTPLFSNFPNYVGVKEEVGKQRLLLWLDTQTAVGSSSTQVFSSFFPFTCIVEIKFFLDDSDDHATSGRTRKKLKADKSSRPSKHKRALSPSIDLANDDNKSLSELGSWSASSLSPVVSDSFFSLLFPGAHGFNVRMQNNATRGAWSVLTSDAFSRYDRIRQVALQIRMISLQAVQRWVPRSRRIVYQFISSATNVKKWKYSRPGFGGKILKHEDINDASNLSSSPNSHLCHRLLHLHRQKARKWVMWTPTTPMKLDHWQWSKWDSATFGTTSSRKWMDFCSAHPDWPYFHTRLIPCMSFPCIYVRYLPVRARDNVHFPEIPIETAHKSMVVGTGPPQRWLPPLWSRPCLMYFISFQVRWFCSTGNKASANENLTSASFLSLFIPYDTCPFRSIVSLHTFR